MKWHAEWWGVVLIPETTEELSLLENLPERAVSFYEEGRTEWETDQKLVADQLRCADKDVHFPLGKCLVLTR